jgi:hypothetical protein
MPSKCSQFTAGQRMSGRRAILDPTNVQGAGFEIDLFPTQVDDLRRSQAMRYMNSFQIARPAKLGKIRVLAMAVG